MKHLPSFLLALLIFNGQTASAADEEKISSLQPKRNAQIMQRIKYTPHFNDLSNKNSRVKGSKNKSFSQSFKQYERFIIESTENAISCWLASPNKAIQINEYFYETANGSKAFLRPKNSYLPSPKKMLKNKNRLIKIEWELGLETDFSLGEINSAQECLHNFNINRKQLAKMNQTHSIGTTTFVLKKTDV